MVLTGTPKEGGHTNVASGGHWTWSGRIFSEEKSDLGEMTAKQLGQFRRMFRVQMFLPSLEWVTQEYHQILILRCHFFINRLALEYKTMCKV